MGIIRDLSNQKIGELTVVKKLRLSKYNYWIWECKCSCGNIIEKTSRQLTFTTKHPSCGCLKKNPVSKTREYRLFKTMHARCYNPNSGKYYTYGKRGIKICDKWLNNFDAFIKDMGPRPSKDHSIGRINNNGDYAPDNCRWETREQQMRNRTITKLTEEDANKIRELNIPQREIASRFGVSQTMVHYIKSNQQWK